MSSGTAHNHKPGREVTPEVAAIDEIAGEFLGNIVPHSWFQNLKTKSGHADLVAITILSEIVYWYRGTNVLEGGKVGRARKFDGDMLQKSYGDLAMRLGLTKDQVTNAVIRLECAGLIKRDFRTITVRGVKMVNVLYIQIFPQRVRAISFFRDERQPEAGVRPTGGYALKEGYVSPDPRTPAAAPDGRCPDARADKYKEYPTEVPIAHAKSREVQTSTTTTTKGKPGKPASDDSFSFNSEESDEMGDLQPGTDESQEAALQLGRDRSRSGENEFAIVLQTLENAFRGNKFSKPGEQGLRDFVRRKLITRQWAEAFALAKRRFDSDRELYKKRKVYIPYRPEYLVKDIELTRKGIIHILGEMARPLEHILCCGFSEEDCVQAQEIIAQYDAFFRNEGWLNPEYKTRHLEDLKLPWHLREEKAIFPVEFLADRRRPGIKKTLVPPVWLRLLYAFQNSLFFEEVRFCLLDEAQEILREDPNCLKFSTVALSDEKIQEIFQLDYKEVYARWKKRNDGQNEQFDKLTTLLAAVTDSEFANQPEPAEDGRDND